MLVRAPVHGAGVPCTMQQILLFLTPGTKPPKRAAAAPCSSSSPLGSARVSSRCVWAEGAKLQPSFEAFGTINHHRFYTHWFYKTQSDHISPADGDLIWSTLNLVKLSFSDARWQARRPIYYGWPDARHLQHGAALQQQQQPGRQETCAVLPVFTAISPSLDSISLLGLAFPSYEMAEQRSPRLGKFPAPPA